jgi:hypothetical protein
MFEKEDTMSKVLRVIFLVFLLCVCTSSWSLDPDDPALVGLWLCDDGAGDTLTDSSGNGNDAAGQFDWDEGKFGDGIVIAGGSIVVPTSNSINSIKEALTVAAWFRIDADSDTGIRRQNAFLLEDQSSSEPVPDGFSFRIWTTNGLSTGAYGMTELEHGEWYHVAGTYDGAVMKLYINGVAEEELKTDGAANFNGEWTGDIATPGDQLQLKYADESFTGAMDEIVIFNRALSETEIKELVKGWEAALAVDTQGKLSTTWGRIKCLRR